MSTFEWGVQLHSPSSALLEEDHWTGSQGLEERKCLGEKLKKKVKTWFGGNTASEHTSLLFLCSPSIKSHWRWNSKASCNCRERGKENRNVLNDGNAKRKQLGQSDNSRYSDLRLQDKGKHDIYLTHNKLTQQITEVYGKFTLCLSYYSTETRHATVSTQNYVVNFT